MTLVDILVKLTQNQSFDFDDIEKCFLMFASDWHKYNAILEDKKCF